MEYLLSGVEDPDSDGLNQYLQGKSDTIQYEFQDYLKKLLVQPQVIVVETPSISRFYEQYFRANEIPVLVIGCEAAEIKELGKLPDCKVLIKDAAKGAAYYDFKAGRVYQSEDLSLDELSNFVDSCRQGRISGKKLNYKR